MRNSTRKFIYLNFSNHKWMDFILLPSHLFNLWMRGNFLFEIRILCESFNYIDIFICIWDGLPWKCNRWVLEVNGKPSIHLTIYINKKHRPTTKKRGGKVLFALIECTAFVKKRMTHTNGSRFFVIKCSS